MKISIKIRINIQAQVPAFKKHHCRSSMYYRSCIKWHNLPSSFSLPPPFQSYVVLDLPCFRIPFHWYTFCLWLLGFPMPGYPPMLTETLITPSTMATFIYTQKSHMFGKYLHIACFSHHFPEPSFLKSFYMCVCVCVCVCVFAVSRAHT